VNRSFVPTARALSAAAFVATAVAAGPAAAAARPAAASRTGSTLTLGVTAEAGYARAVILRCSPAGGGHPSAAKACAALKPVAGKPGRLTPAEVVCTLQFAPVTATATGTWKGKKVSWSRTFGNGCELVRATGVVFRF
jgi:hypothetical protein